MAVHPQVQNRIQIELHNAIGGDHLPHPSDLGRLPYLTAVFKEVLRYAPVANLGKQPRNTVAFRAKRPYGQLFLTV